MRITPFVLLAATVCCMQFSLNTANGDDWFKGGNFYQIYPRQVLNCVESASKWVFFSCWNQKITLFLQFRSFKDSNGDGIGDLNGITSKLEYLKEIGVTGVWLSPIFKSPST